MKCPIKIMQIVLSLECGGLEKMVISLAQKLDKDKFNTTICCLDRLGNLSNETKEGDIKVISLKRKNGVDLSLLFKLAYILKKEKIKLIHTHNMGPLFYGTLAAKIAKIPIIINTRHGRERKKSNRFIWELNDKIITISNDAKNELFSCNKISPEKVKVIYNGIDVEKYKKGANTYEIKKKLGIKSSAFIVGTVARLAEEKDQFTLLDAFYKIAQAMEDVKLIIVGDGVLRKELEGYSEKLGITDKTIFLGFQQNISEIVNVFDVFVLSSLTEGISLTLLEAMAASKPIVATNVGGNPEVVIDGVSGFLVPPKDSEKMAETIITLLQNKELAKGMGEAGYKRVKQEFDLDIMVKEYEKLYDYWLDKKGIV